MVNFKGILCYYLYMNLEFVVKKVSDMYSNIDPQDNTNIPENNILDLVNQRGVFVSALPHDVSKFAMQDIFIARHEIAYALRYIELREEIGNCDEDFKNYKIFIYQLHCRYLACRGHLVELEKYQDALLKLDGTQSNTQQIFIDSLNLSANLTSSLSTFVLKEIAKINFFRQYFTWLSVYMQFLIIIFDEDNKQQEIREFQSVTITLSWALYLIRSSGILLKFIMTVSGAGMSQEYNDNVSLLMRLSVAIEEYGDQLLNDIAWWPSNFLNSLEFFNITHFSDLNIIGGAGSIGVILYLLDIAVALKNLQKISYEKEQAHLKYEAGIEFLQLQEYAEQDQSKKNEIYFEIYCLQYAQKFNDIDFDLEYQKNLHVLYWASCLFIASVLLSASVFTPLGLSLSAVFILGIAGSTIAMFATTFYCIGAETLVFNKYTAELNAVKVLMEDPIFQLPHKNENITNEYTRLQGELEKLEQCSFHKNYSLLVFFIFIPVIVFLLLWFTSLPHTAILPVFFMVYSIVWLANRTLNYQGHDNKNSFHSSYSHNDPDTDGNVNVNAGDFPGI
jgi:hypothetical protein